MAARGRPPHLSRFEFRVMQLFWDHGPLSVREVRDRLAGPAAAYTTVQTIVRRLEEKGAVRQVRRVGNARVFEAAVPRRAAYKRLVGELLAFFGGSPAPLLAHLVEAGRLDLDDLRAAEELLSRKR